MLVLGRKPAKMLEKENLDKRLASVQIRVPASTVDQMIEVMLIDVREGQRWSRIGIVADRAIEVRRMEIVE